MSERHRGVVDTVDRMQPAPSSAAGLPPLPTFLIIGAQKSATRWLRINLGAHPEIFTAVKELEFFDRKYGEGLDAYRRGFDGWAGEPVVGEATPGYMLIWETHPWKVARRIDRSLPDVRLIALLRNPVDRTYSAFLHHVARGRIAPDADLMTTVERVRPMRDGLSLISGGLYAKSLKPYQRRFGDRLLVLLQDDVVTDPKGVYDRAVAHVRAAPGFVPPGLDRVWFATDEELPPETARLGADGRRRPLAPQERRGLYRYFRRDIDRLEELFDLDLSSWRPEPAPGPKAFAYGLRSSRPWRRLRRTSLARRLRP